MITATYTKTYESGRVAVAELHPPSWAAANRLGRLLKAQEEHLDQDAGEFYRVTDFEVEEKDDDAE